MTKAELLSVKPSELKFSFELKKQISCSLHLSNKTGNYVAFKVKTTNPKNYCARPNTGIVLPWSTCDIIVTMQAQKEAPLDMKCKDKFLLQSVVASSNTNIQDINRAMFNKEAGNAVEECELRVVYVSPPQPPSYVQERSEESSSLWSSVTDNDNLNSFKFNSVSVSFAESHSFLATLDTLSSQSEALISKLAEVKVNAFQHNSPLRLELQDFKSKDANNTRTTRQEELKIHLLSDYGDKSISQKIQAFEAALEDANTKFLALEVALKDTKLVLEGLGSSIEDFSS